jgi:branched-chain amino acid transport system ATP-binding protein
MTDAPASALTTTALVAGYERDLPIVQGIDFSVNRGELVAVLGPNGAGKSTFVKAIEGLVPIHSGRILLGDIDLTNAALHERVRHGLAFVPQTENVFASLTIGENLQLAADILPRTERSGRVAAMYTLFPDLGARPSLRAGGLSGGQRQMLAIARALIVEPRVLVLDEPSAGLSPRVAAEVFTNLKAINGAGVTIILVEQNIKAALAIAHRGVILAEGRLRHEGKAAALLGDPMIAELYLGARNRARAAP